MTVQPGDVVVIQGSERNRGKWNIGIVVKLIKGRDGVVHAIRLRALARIARGGWELLKNLMG